MATRPITVEIPASTDSSGSSESDNSPSPLNSHSDSDPSLIVDEESDSEESDTEQEKAVLDAYGEPMYSERTLAEEEAELIMERVGRGKHAATAVWLKTH